MDLKYLELLAKEYPTAEAVSTEIINLSAIRSLPKGTEYFFSDLHGEYEAFLHLLKSASGMIDPFFASLSRGQLVYFTTFKPLCQGVFSDFFEIFLESQIRLSRGDLISLPSNPKNVKHFF